MPRGLRAKRNSEFFRDVNERISLLEAKWLVREPIGFVCECANLGCRAPIYVTVAEFREIRRIPGRAITLPGHTDTQHDRFIWSTPRYAVVEPIEALDVASDR